MNHDRHSSDIDHKDFMDGYGPPIMPSLYDDDSIKLDPVGLELFRKEIAKITASNNTLKLDSTELPKKKIDSTASDDTPES